MKPRATPCFVVALGGIATGFFSCRDQGAGSTLNDLAGKHLMPSFIAGHGHFDGRLPRDPGQSRDIPWFLKRRIATPRDTPIARPRSRPARALTPRIERRAGIASFPPLAARRSAENSLRLPHTPP